MTTGEKHLKRTCFICLLESLLTLDNDTAAIASGVSRPRPDTMEIVTNEQTILSAYQTVKEKMQQRRPAVIRIELMFIHLNIIITLRVESVPLRVESEGGITT